MGSNQTIADEPPAILDSAVVVQYARLDDTAKYTGRGYMLVGGVITDPVPCLVIAKNIRDGCILLFWCDTDWQVIGAGGYDTVEEARDAAERTYSGVDKLWNTFRGLTQVEVDEVEETRQFLKEHPGPNLD